MAKKTIPQVKLNVDNLLKEKDLSVDAVVEMCEKAGAPITRTTVYNMLNPYAKGVHLTSLTALCVGLNVKPADLFVMEEGK